MAFFSYSQLTDYLFCPQRFKWARMDHRKPQHRVEKPPVASFTGSLFATLVDTLYRERWYEQPTTVLPRLRGLMMEAANHLTVAQEIVWPPGAKNRAVGQVDDCLPLVLQTMQTEQLIGARNLTEYEVVVALDSGDQVTGTIDLLIEQPNGDLHLVDGKSGNPRYAKPDQLRLYALGTLHDETLRRLPTKAGFWFFREGRVSWRRINVTVLAKFRTGVQATVARLKSRDYDPAPGPQCRVCQYRSECEAGLKYLFSDIKSHGLGTDANVGEVSL